MESRFSTLTAKVDALAAALPPPALRPERGAVAKKKKKKKKGGPKAPSTAGGPGGPKAPSNVGGPGGRNAPPTVGGQGGRSAPPNEGRKGRSAPSIEDGEGGDVPPSVGAASSDLPVADSFATVTKRRGKGRQGKGVTVAPVQGAPPPHLPKSRKGFRDSTAPPSGGAASSKTSKAGRAVARARRRLPRSAAVLLTAPTGQYSEAMSRAKKEISLEALGISSLRTRSALTGALLLEIPGVDNEAKADALASQMRRALDGMDGVSISRPSRSHELRLRGLDVSVTVEDVLSAVAEQGGCGRDTVRVGPFRPAPTGLRNVWVRCPARAALLLATPPGRLRIGWSTVQVDLLGLRPTRCYRCLARGHTQQRCPPSMLDRARCCYNCGKEGHGSASCGNPPHCPICASTGKEARHRAGSVACPPVPPAARVGVIPAPPPKQTRVLRARSGSGGRGRVGGSRGEEPEPGGLEPGGSDPPMDIDGGSGADKRAREVSGDSPPQPTPKKLAPGARDESTPRPGPKSRKRSL